MFALLASTVALLGSFGCAGAGPHTGVATGPSSAGTVVGASAAADGKRAIPTGPHTFGDYDDDDGYYDVGPSDYDNDDSEKPTDKDGDFDSSGGGQYDSDDNSVRYFGHSARPADRRAITALSKIYYAAAVADDGAKACSLIASPIAKLYPQSLGVGGPPYLRGLKTCAEIVSKLFDQNHTQVRADAATLRVTNVRVEGKLGLAVLAFNGRPGRQMETIREHRSWKMLFPLDTELP
ncbi:MAG: hypothetical protein WBV85_08085 [Solirubrobacteraceae bacterium]